MSGGNGGTTFNQPGQSILGNQTNIGSVEGGYNIGLQTPKADMDKTIVRLKAEIAALPSLQPEVRTQLNEALDSVVGVSPSPSQGEVKTKLDHAGNALAGAATQLEGADDLAQKALKLAKTIFSIGKWVVSAVSL